MITSEAVNFLCDTSEFLLNEINLKRAGKPWTSCVQGWVILVFSTIWSCRIASESVQFSAQFFDENVQILRQSDNLKSDEINPNW